MKGAPFYAWCGSGYPDHIMEAIAGSELEKRCEEYAKAGNTGMLRLRYDECPGCVEYKRRQIAEREANYLSIHGCLSRDPADKCKNSSACRHRKQTADSPYASQWLSVSVLA